MMNASTTIVLVGHGTRDEVGRGEFLALADLLAARSAPSPVVPCFLEFARPTIGEAVIEAVAAGADEIVVAPLMLFAAGHAKHDIPAAVESALRRAAGQHHRRVAWRQADVLGCHEKLVELSARRHTEAIARGPLSKPVQPHAGALPTEPVPADDETCLVLVGRGSYDADATAEMRLFARLRLSATPVARCDVAFLAMAEPRYRPVLRAAGERGWRRIVVQPHLLFAGELLERLRGDVAALTGEFSATEWMLAEHLGADRLLADAVWDLCRGGEASRVAR